MALGSIPTAIQIYHAMCADYKNLYGTNPLTISAEQLARAYYGWTADDPTVQFVRAGCPT